MTERGVRELIEARARKAGGVRALARLWGVSPAHVSDVCNGRRGPGPLLLAHLGLVRRVTVEYVPAGGEA